MKKRTIFKIDFPELPGVDEFETLAFGKVWSASVVLDNALWMIGGQLKRSDKFCDSVVRTDLKTFEVEVKKRPPLHKRMPIVAGHRCIAYKGKIYCWGGVQEHYRKYMNSLYEYSPAENHWRKIRVTGDIPSAREGHSLTLGPSDMVYLMGGSKTDSFDVFELDIQRRTFTHQFPPLGGQNVKFAQNVLGDGVNNPGQRFYHSCVYSKRFRRFLICGGLRLGGGTNLDMKKVFVYCPKKMGFLDSIDVPKCLHAPRSEHTAELIGDKMVLLFGRATTEDTALAIFDLHTNQWTHRGCQGQGSGGVDKLLLSCSPLHIDNFPRWYSDKGRVIAGHTSATWCGNRIVVTGGRHRQEDSRRDLFVIRSNLKASVSRGGRERNERLKFLGDRCSVLGLVHLFL